MRRITAVLLALCLLASAVPALAQAPFTVVGPGGVLDWTTSTITRVNATQGSTIYTYTVPAGYAQKGSTPLHLKLLGRVSTNLSSGGVGASFVTISYGGSTASLTLVNTALDDTLSNAGWELDAWLSFVPATATTENTQYLHGRFRYQSATAGTVKEYSSTVQGTTSMRTPQVLLVQYGWASASTTNTLSRHSGVLTIGE